MFQFLQTRITLISLFLGIVIATDLIIAGVQLISKLVSENLTTHSRLAAQELVGQINQLKALGLEFDDIIDFDEQCRLVLSKDTKIAFAGVYDGDGVLRFKSNDVALNWPLNNAIDLNAARDEQQISTDKHLIVLHPITPEETLSEGYVVVAVDRALLHEATFKAIWHFIIVAAILVLISLTIHFLFLRRSVIQPVGKLVGAVKAVNPANFNGVLNDTNTNKGEIGELAQAFTNLLSQLTAAQNESLAQASRAINAEKQLNRTIVESSPLAIYTRNINGLITGWNKACERMFGWKEEEVIGNPFLLFPRKTKTKATGCASKPYGANMASR